jgi:hypothetical protein
LSWLYGTQCRLGIAEGRFLRKRMPVDHHCEIRNRKKTKKDDLSYSHSFAALPNFAVIACWFSGLMFVCSLALTQGLSKLKTANRRAIDIPSKSL